MLDFDFVDWDDEDDPAGNVVHIEAAGLTPGEVEEVLRSPDVTTGKSRTSGRPYVRGYTAGAR